MNYNGYIQIKNDNKLIDNFNTFFNCINLLQINEQNHLPPELERYLGVSILIEFLFYPVNNYSNYYFRINNKF